MNHGFEDRKGIKVNVLVKQYIQRVPPPEIEILMGGGGAFSKLVKMDFFILTEMDLFPLGKNPGSAPRC
jgi:hypothetical protein